jgi:hypothetical protein
MRVLLRLMQQIEKRLENRDCDEIVEALAFYRAQVKNDFTAKVTCREICRMCVDKAWANRLVTGMDYADWLLLLKELRTTTERALEKIEARLAGT